MSGSPQPTLDPWSEPVARAADPGHGLATVAFVIGVASLLWELVGGVILPPLATAALREQAQGQAVAMLHLLVGAAAGLAPIVGLVIAVVLGHRALRRIRSAGTDMGGIIWATAATVTGWVGIGQLLVGFVLIPFAGPFHNLVDQLRMVR